MNQIANLFKKMTKLLVACVLIAVALFSSMINYQLLKHLHGILVWKTRSPSCCIILYHRNNLYY